MIEAKLADGTTLKFPDGTADDVVDRVVQEHMTTGAARTATREQNTSLGGTLAGAKRAIESGMTFGLRDEAQAAISGVVNAGVSGLTNLFRGGGRLSDQITGRPTGFSDTYDQTLGQERQQSREFAEDRPATAIAGNILGGAVVPGGMGSGFIRGKGLLAGAGRGLVAGGTGGAASGFGDAEGGLGNRLIGAATGLGIGAAGGVALGAGVNAASRVGGRVLDVAGLRNPEVAADRQILRALERDFSQSGKTMADLAAEAAAPPGGAPLALADLGGRNTTSLAAVAANVPGRSMEAADALVQARRAAGPDRMAAASDQAFGGGSGDDIAAQMEALGRRRSADAAPRYEASFSRITPTADEIARVEPAISDRIGQDALQQGLRVMEVENVAARLRDPSIAPFNPADYGVVRGEDGNFVTQDGYRNLRLLDAVKRGYDEIVEGFRDQTSGRLNLNQYGRAVNDARAGYVGQLREMYPRYGGALDAWGGPSQSIDAVNRGRRAFTADRDAVESAATNLSPGNQDFYRLGAGRALSDMASDPAKAPGVARRMLEDRQMQDRLATLLPPDRNAALADALRGEVRVKAGNDAYSPRAGSQTARLQAGADDMAIDPPGGMVMALLNATQRGGITGAMAKGGEVLYRRGQGINSSTADALAERLFKADPVENAAIIRALTARQGKDALTAQQRGALAEQLLRGLGVAGGMQATD